jgi:hypothetical protein
MKRSLFKAVVEDDLVFFSCLHEYDEECQWCKIQLIMNSA